MQRPDQLGRGFADWQDACCNQANQRLADIHSVGERSIAQWPSFATASASTGSEHDPSAKRNARRYAVRVNECRDNVTVSRSPLNITVAPHDPDGGCADCDDQEFAHDVRHTIFDVRFAPPWSNADQRSLFTSYVVFPKEAKFTEWSMTSAPTTVVQEAMLQPSVRTAPSTSK